MSSAAKKRYMLQLQWRVKDLKREVEIAIARVKPIKGGSTGKGGFCKGGIGKARKGAPWAFIFLGSFLVCLAVYTPLQ